MNNLLTIEKIDAVQTLDNKDLYVFTGAINSHFNLGVQPSKSIIVQLNSNLQVGDTIEVGKNNPLWLIDVEKHHSWEIFGSNYNSGKLWYGKKEELDKIEQQLYNAVVNNIKNEKFDNLADDNGNKIDDLPIVRWDFEDETSLIIYYRDQEYFPGLDMKKINEKNVIHYCFGAVTNDILAHEIISPLAFKLTKKVKIPHFDISEEDFEDMEDNVDFIFVGDKKLKKQDNDLVLDLSYHLYCSLMMWHENTNLQEQDSQDVIIAKKLFKYQQVKNLSLPQSGSSQRMTWIDDSSNKEYIVHLKENAGNYVVETQYGGIGKTQKNDILITTKDLSQAQNIYREILKDKLYKGYSLDSQLANNLKIKI